jgi:hypothetical protein
MRFRFFLPNTSELPFGGFVPRAAARRRAEAVVLGGFSVDVGFGEKLSGFPMFETHVRCKIFAISNVRFPMFVCVPPREELN